MSYINQNYKLFEQHKRELFVILNDNYFFLKFIEICKLSLNFHKFILNYF